MPDDPKNLNKNNQDENTPLGDVLGMTARDMSEQAAPDVSYSSYGERPADEMQSSGRLTNSGDYVDEAAWYAPYASPAAWAEWGSPHSDDQIPERQEPQVQRASLQPSTSRSQQGTTIPRVVGRRIADEFRPMTAARRAAEARTYTVETPQKPQETPEGGIVIPRVVGRQMVGDDPSVPRNRTPWTGGRRTRQTREAQDSPQAVVERPEAPITSRSPIERRQEHIDELFDRETTHEDFSYYTGYRTHAGSAEGEQARREEARQDRKPEFKAAWAARDTSYARPRESVESRRDELDQLSASSVRFAVPLPSARGVHPQDHTTPRSDLHVFDLATLHAAQVRQRKQRGRTFVASDQTPTPQAEPFVPDETRDVDRTHPAPSAPRMTRDTTEPTLEPRVTIPPPKETAPQLVASAAQTGVMSLSGTADLTINGVPMGELQLNLEGIGG